MRGNLLGLVATFAAAAGIACGGGGAEAVDAVDWAEDVCDIAVDYNRASDALGNEFVEVDTSDAKSAQKEYGSILGEVGKLQEAALKKVEELGDPDVEGGKQVHEAFVANLKATIQEREQLASTIKALDPGGRRFQQDLDAAFEKVDVPSLRVGLAGVIEDHAEAGRIVELIEGDPECAGVLFADEEGAPAATPTRSAAGPTRTPSTTGGTKNERWVGGLCQAVTAYQADLITLAGSIALSPSASGAQIKASLVGFLEDARARTQALKRDIDALGNPNVQDGAQIQASFSAAAAQAVKIFDTAITTAQGLSTTDLATLAEGAVQIGEDLAAAADEVGSRFGEVDFLYDTTELSAIADRLAECAGLF